MRKQFKTLLSFVLVSVLLLSAVGCSNENPSVIDGSGTATDDGTVTTLPGDEMTTNPAADTDIREIDYSKKEFSYADFKNTVKDVGRVQETKNGLSIDWGASGISFNAACEGDIYMRFATSTGNIYLTIFIDGEVSSRITTKDAERIDITNKRLKIASNLEKGVHTIEIYRSNGPQVGRFFLRGLEMSGEFLDPPKDQLLIEFIGDSLSAGVGVYGKSSEPAAEGCKDANEDSLVAYPFLTTRELGCDLTATCISGVGLVAGTIGSHYAMTKIYELTSWHRNDTEMWDFRRTADIVVINLGTNDAGNLFNYGHSIAEFKEALRTFIATIQARHPGCKIVWAYGLMTMNFSDMIQEAITELNGVNGNELYFCELPQGLDGGGAHPNVENQRAAADVMIEFLKGIMKE